MCRTIFETLWGKLQNLLEIKLTTGITLLLLSAVDIDVFVYFNVTSMSYETNFWITFELNQ